MEEEGLSALIVSHAAPVADVRMHGLETMGSRVIGDGRDRMEVVLYLQNVKLWDATLLHLSMRMTQAWYAYAELVGRDVLILSSASSFHQRRAGFPSSSLPLPSFPSIAMALQRQLSEKRKS